MLSDVVSTDEGEGPEIVGGVGMEDSIIRAGRKNEMY